MGHVGLYFILWEIFWAALVASRGSAGGPPPLHFFLYSFIFSLRTKVLQPRQPNSYASASQLLIVDTRGHIRTGPEKVTDQNGFSLLYSILSKSLSSFLSLLLSSILSLLLNLLLSFLLSLLLSLMPTILISSLISSYIIGCVLSLSSKQKTIFLPSSNQLPRMYEQ